jgi:hypothetical protein
MANDSQVASNTQPEGRKMVACRRKGQRNEPHGNTAPLAWQDQAGSSRFDHGLGGACHDVSVIGVWRLGLGGKTAILAIRPW